MRFFLRFCPYLAVPLITALLSLPCQCLANRQDVETVHKALSAFYLSTNGDSWAHRTGWNVTTVPQSMAEFNQWHGLRVVGSTLVRIDLPRNDLSGSLPPELGNLSGLRALVLWRNHLEGSIPFELGNLSALKRLNLIDNQLTTVPPELGNLSALEGLWLSSNQLATVPPELGNLSSLVTLMLYDNQLATIPTELGSLSKLKGLGLGNNQLTTLPPELGNL